MENLTLTAGEKKLIAEILEEYLPELRAEIEKTDNRLYKDGLKAKEAVLKIVLAKLH